MVSPGKYLGKIVGCGFTESKAGDAYPFIQFQFADHEGKFHNLTWKGTLKEGKGKVITIDTLLRCGLKGNNIFAISDGVSALDVTKEMSLDVVHQITDEGKTYANIAWVNTPGGTGPKKVLSKEELKAKVAGKDFEADVAMRREETKIKDTSWLDI